MARISLTNFMTNVPQAVLKDPNMPIREAQAVTGAVQENIKQVDKFREIQAEQEAIKRKEELTTSFENIKTLNIQDRYRDGKSRAATMAQEAEAQRKETLDVLLSQEKDWRVRKRLKDWYTEENLRRRKEDNTYAAAWAKQDVRADTFSGIENAVNAGNYDAALDYLDSAKDAFDPEEVVQLQQKIVGTAAFNGTKSLIDGIRLGAEANLEYIINGVKDNAALDARAKAALEDRAKAQYFQLAQDRNANIADMIARGDFTGAEKLNEEGIKVNPRFTEMTYKDNRLKIQREEFLYNFRAEAESIVPGENPSGLYSAIDSKVSAGIFTPEQGYGLKKDADNIRVMAYTRKVDEQIKALYEKGYDKTSIKAVIHEQNQMFFKSTAAEDMGLVTPEGRNNLYNAVLQIENRLDSDTKAETDRAMQVRMLAGQRPVDKGNTSAVETEDKLAALSVELVTGAEGVKKGYIPTVLMETGVPGKAWVRSVKVQSKGSNRVAPELLAAAQSLLGDPRVPQDQKALITGYLTETVSQNPYMMNLIDLDSEKYDTLNLAMTTAQMPNISSDTAEMLLNGYGRVNAEERKANEKFLAANFDSGKKFKELMEDRFGTSDGNTQGAEARFMSNITRYYSAINQGTPEERFEIASNMAFNAAVTGLRESGGRINVDVGSAMPELPAYANRDRATEQFLAFRDQAAGGRDITFEMLISTPAGQALQSYVVDENGLSNPIRYEVMVNGESRYLPYLPVSAVNQTEEVRVAKAKEKAENEARAKMGTLDRSPVGEFMDKTKDLLSQSASTLINGIVEPPKALTKELRTSWYENRILSLESRLEELGPKHPDRIRYNAAIAEYKERLKND